MLVRDYNIKIQVLPLLSLVTEILGVAYTIELILTVHHKWIMLFPDILYKPPESPW